MKRSDIDIPERHRLDYTKRSLFNAIYKIIVTIAIHNVQITLI